MTLYAQNARDEILEAPPVRGMRIVGIDGPSGAGKSTFALQLAPLLDAPIIHIDDFVSGMISPGGGPGLSIKFSTRSCEVNRLAISKETGLPMNLVIPSANGRRWRGVQ